MFNYFVTKGVMTLVAALLALQLGIIYVDLVMATGPFDELASFLNITAMAWLVRKQRTLAKVSMR